MKKISIKSSALLIAMIVGMVLMILIVGVSVVVSQQSRSAGQSRDGKIAYRAALSGIEDGLLRYKFAQANQKLSQVFGNYSNIQISSEEMIPKASYNLSIGLSSLSAGNYNNLLDPRLKQKITLDNPIDINLTPLLNIEDSKKKVRKVLIKFTDPYQKNALGQEREITGSFTAMNVKLIDTAEYKTAETQLIKEETNTVSTKDSMSVDGIDTLCLPSSECHLRLRPQFATLTISTEAKRISGSQISQGGKYIYLAIEAYDANDEIIDIPTTDKPGTVLISSVGIAGQARRKLEAKVDAGSGAYIGLFDWGVYCGETCNWGTKGIDETKNPN